VQRRLPPRRAGIHACRSGHERGAGGGSGTGSVTYGVRPGLVGDREPHHHRRRFQKAGPQQDEAHGVSIGEQAPQDGLGQPFGPSAARTASARRTISAT